MVCGGRSASRITGRQERARSACAEAFLASPRMGCGKTQNKRKTCEDGLEELAAKVAEKGIQGREIRDLASQFARCLSVKAGLYDWSLPIV